MVWSSVTIGSGGFLRTFGAASAAKTRYGFSLPETNNAMTSTPAVLPTHKPLRKLIQHISPTPVDRTPQGL